jgi:hypothetical protein
MCVYTRREVRAGLLVVTHLIDPLPDLLLVVLLAHACCGLEGKVLTHRQVAKEHLVLMHEGYSMHTEKRNPVFSPSQRRFDRSYWTEIGAAGKSYRSIMGNHRCHVGAYKEITRIYSLEISEEGMGSCGTI